MYPHSQIWRPLALMGALVAATAFATETIAVEPGDTLSEIAARHDVTVDQLMEWNELSDADRIFAGATLIVSDPDTGGAPAREADGHHVVSAGDTLSAIAARFGTSVARLVAANRLADPNRIFIGQSILVSAAPTSTAPTTTAPPRRHTVVAGDTLTGIAARYGVKAGVLAEHNGIADADLIVIGRVLTIGEPASPPHASPPPASPPPASPPPASPPPTTTVAPAPAPTTTTPYPTTSNPATSNPASPPTTRPPTSVRDADEVLLTPIFARWADVYDVPQGLLEAIAWRESTWTPGAVGSGGRLGIMQLSPDTVEFIEGGLLGQDLDPLDADNGIQMGARFLRYLLDRTDNDREATAAWVQGLHGVQTNGVSAVGGDYVDSIEEIRRQRS